MEQNNKIQLRLTALWALSESGLGGVMHALKIPLTGIFLGGFAVVIVTLLAQYAQHKWSVILKATLLVILVKAAASPHSPPAAYIAVAFQGLVGALFYTLFKVNWVSASLFGAIAMAESALQKLLVMTLIYGANIWVALDSFFQTIVKSFSVKTTLSFSYTLLFVYLGFHVLWGVFTAIWVLRFSQKLPQLSKSISQQYQLQQKSTVTFNNKYSKNKRVKLFSLLLVLMFITTVFVLQGWSGKALYTVLRTIAAVLLLFFVINPLIKWLTEKWLSNQKQKHQKKLHEILLLLPTIKLYVAPAMALAQQHKNKIKRYFHFVSNIIVLSVFINKDDEQV